ncbi:hypothetical protein BH20ACT17_BH20ACT17_13370 [soil metagenome]
MGLSDRLKKDRAAEVQSAEIVPGITEPSTTAFDANAVEVQKDGWPRELLVVREKGSDLGDALREKVARWDYEPEDSLGFCSDPNANRSISRGASADAPVARG